MAKITDTHPDVRSIYDDDHSEDLLELFLDPKMVYTCAYYERDDMTLAEAQVAKLNLSLGKCGLKPGMKLLEIGCGYGACAQHAAEEFGANVIAVTPSVLQARHATERARNLKPGSGTMEVRNEGWETFREPVDRVVSIGALEHIRSENYPALFERLAEITPADTRMMIHCIVRYDWRDPQRQQEFKEKGIALTHEDVLFAKFIAKEVFPGGELLDPKFIMAEAAKAGFVTEHTDALGQHYARTCDAWADNLEASKDKAIALKGQAIYDHYMKYLRGCAHHFRIGFIDLFQFTFTKG